MIDFTSIQVIRKAQWASYIVTFIIVTMLILRYFRNPALIATTSEEFWLQSRIRSYNRTMLHANITKDKRDFFPQIVHQTWKSKSLPPHQTLRWRSACKKLNPTHEFKMFDDDDLMAFTLKYYPMYGTILQSLQGVCK